jgi:hypothetical protein
MTAFCRWWALAGIGLVALASLGLRSDNSDIVGSRPTRRLVLSAVR